MKNAVKFVTCAKCLNRCQLRYETQNGTLTQVLNAACHKGIKYVKEIMDVPDTLIVQTVYLKNGMVSHAEVKTSAPVPGHMVNDVKEALEKIEIEAPITFGQVLIENFMDTGCDLISRSTVAKSK